jgi:hypothetical protein
LVTVEESTDALTANPPGQVVRLEGRLSGDRLHLRVIDHGPGLPDAEHDRVFARSSARTITAVLVSGWVWPSHAASPKPWAARSPRPKRPVED